MKRNIAGITRVLAGLLFVLITGVAQAAPDVPLIGYLDFGSATSGTTYVKAFRQGLRDLGWVEGKNFEMQVRYAEGNHARFPELAAELVRLKADLIFASTTPAALAAKRAAPATPVVFGFVADPVGSGLVTSLAHPGGNITGWSHLAGVALNAKRLELLIEAVPDVARVGALWNPANPIHEPSLQYVAAAAGRLKVQLETVGAESPEELDNAFSTVERAGVQALTVPPDGMFIAEKASIIALAAKYRIPTMYGVLAMAEDGGLMAYGVNLPDQFRRGAIYVDKILSGVSPASLPVEQPTRFELVLNLKTAKALGIKFPRELLLLADKIIQ